MSIESNCFKSLIFWKIIFHNRHISEENKYSFNYLHLFHVVDFLNYVKLIGDEIHLIQNLKVLISLGVFLFGKLLLLKLL